MSAFGDFMSIRKITSSDNKIYKKALSLLKKKYRDSEGLYLIEGENLLEEAVKCRQDIKTVFVSESYSRSLFGQEDKAFVLDDKLFSKLSETETSQGVISVVKKPEAKASDFINLSGDCFVVLDRLQDPGNIGTIIRTADGAGYKLAIVMKGTADVFSSKVVRAATGSLFRMPVVYMASAKELAEFTRAAGKKLVVSSLDNSRYYYHEDLSKDIVLVIGNEGNGVSEELMDCSDLKVKIPMQGNIESLNASVAAGILLYERIRKENAN